MTVVAHGPESAACSLGGRCGALMIIAVHRWHRRIVRPPAFFANTLPCGYATRRSAKTDDAGGPDRPDNAGVDPVLVEAVGFEKLAADVEACAKRVLEHAELARQEAEQTAAKNNGMRELHLREAAVHERSAAQLKQTAALYRTRGRELRARTSSDSPDRTAAGGVEAPDRAPAERRSFAAEREKLAAERIALPPSERNSHLSASRSTRRCPGQ
jgi:hypothetical protein